ncbi:MAG TPA: GntR family transcriptional regulator [Candidatus Dormibacteraeota bacterium]|jgi:DNA-binding transcriptional regulator YhcF (GntR family)|nr:GntR family transcriptional regulator [Candidatus Dormibacteraeota bacterium]
MSLDPDDPRPPYVQVANALRAAILTKTLAPGEQLPSGNDLAKRYGVARMTVQHALRTLREEGLIVSRQGSGVFVRERTERPIGLRPHIERAFERPHVSIDFAGFSGETLHGVLQEPLDKIRIGRLVPETIAVRVLVPDTSSPMALPCRIEDLADDPDFRERAGQIMRRHTQAIADSVHELADLGLVKEATAQIRVHPCTPLFKLYLLNNEDAFFGFYPVREHTVTLKGEPRPIYDLMGKDAILFHHTTTDDDTSTDSQYVEQARMWFDSMWNTVGRDFTP